MGFCDQGCTAPHVEVKSFQSPVPSGGQHEVGIKVVHRRQTGDLDRTCHAEPDNSSASALRLVSSYLVFASVDVIGEQLDLRARRQ